MNKIITVVILISIILIFFVIAIMIDFIIKKKKKPSYHPTYEEEKLKLVNLKINELYQNFKEKIDTSDDGTGGSLTYWYNIVKTMASKYPYKNDTPLDLQIKESIYGNYDEYKTKVDLINTSIEELEDFAKVRIFSFGEIFTQLELLDKNINKKLIAHQTNEHQISVQLTNEISRAKARTYGAIKFALSVDISKKKIKNWFPAFIDDKDLIKGVNPWDTLSEKYDLGLNTLTPQYELSEEEKKNIPDWYTGAVDSKGSKIKVDERGNEITLNGLETSIYNLTKMNNLLIANMQKDIESGKADKIILEAPIYHNMINQLKQGKVWLKENNIEAYKVLFNDVEDNTASSNDKSESSHYQIASDYEKNGKYKLAVEHYTKSIETYPNHVYSFVNRGRIYDEVTGQLKLAVADYTQAINIDPNDATIYYNRGNVLTKLKKYDDGIKDFTKAIEIDPNDSSSFKNRGIAKQRAGIDPSSDWKKACSLGIEECCIWYEEDMKRDSQTSDTDKYLKDIMLEHFIKFPPIPTYYSWLKKVANDNELKEDEISENKENFYTLLQLCGKVISPESKKQIKYFKDLIKGYISSDEEKAKKESDIFLNKLNNYEDSYQYFESIVRRLSDYNKLVFIYTIWDLLLINFEGQDVNLEENFYTGNIEPAFWLGDILADEGLLVEFFEIKNREGIVGLMVARRVLKLQTENMISKKLSNLEEQEKDIIIYLMYNFLVRKKNRKTASREYGHIISLLNYDLNRIIKSNVSSPEEFVSENNALNWLNNADDESKNFVEVLIQRIIVSDFHYSFSEQTYLSKITEVGNLSGMYRENKTHVWLRSICDDDKKDILDKLSTQLKTQAEIYKEIKEEKDLVNQEKLYKSAINKFPNWSEIKNSYCYNLYEQKKFKEGIKIIQDLMHKNPRYYDTCGLGYYYLEEYEKALELMNKCIQLDPTGKNCYVNEHYLTRGNVFIKMNQISNAKQDFKAALNFNYPYFKKHGNPKLKKSMEKLVENALLKCI